MAYILTGLIGLQHFFGLSGIAVVFKNNSSGGTHSEDRAFRSAYRLLILRSICGISMTGSLKLKFESISNERLGMTDMPVFGPILDKEKMGF